jgi:hypothetical protein
MEIIGYSERGMVNSFFYEIKNREQEARGPLVLLNDFFSAVSFPFPKPKFDIKDAKVLIEQSFSDFGDADAVLLIDNNGQKQAIFMEAKVQTALRQAWTISEEYRKFAQGYSQNKVRSSNLFAQLYYKVRLIRTLKTKGKVCLEKGVAFPACFSKELRKIGRNPIILGAVERLLPYRGEAFFVSLVPDSRESVLDFCKNLAERIKNDFPELQDWDMENWGFITWGEVNQYCRKWGMAGTLSNFDLNKGQIYGQI